jgi:hypothetical protein
MVPAARLPRSIDARAIVSPFDPLLWERKWTRAVLDFDYQIEIYVPGHKRVHGYYVLPFLMGDRFAARVDLKADRKASVLVVHAAYVEPGFRPLPVASALTDALRSMASWLSLKSFKVGGRGNLAPALRSELRARGRAAVRLLAVLLAVALAAAACGGSRGSAPAAPTSPSQPRYNLEPGGPFVSCASDHMPRCPFS